MHFAIIELLLTHKPHVDFDSLQHQVSNKIPMLDRKFALGLNYAQFGGAKANTVWKALYDYRSFIAHGGTPSEALLKKMVVLIPLDVLCDRL